MTSTSGADDSGTRAPSGSTSVDRQVASAVAIGDRASAAAAPSRQSWQARVLQASERARRVLAMARRGAATIVALAMTAPTAATRGSAHPRAFDERQLRDALAQFATGVTIICARAPDRALRRLHRELVQFGLARPAARHLEPVTPVDAASPRSRAAERYAVNVLATSQVELARRFSRPHADRFAGVAVPARLVGRAADRRLRRMVRVPPSRAASRRRPRALHRRGRHRRTRDAGAASCSITAALARPRRSRSERDEELTRRPHGTTRAVRSGADGAARLAPLEGVAHPAEDGPRRAAARTAGRRPS